MGAPSKFCLGATAPASVAALTAATSPTTNAAFTPAAADLVPAVKLDIGGLQHGVGGLDKDRKALDFNHANASNDFAMTILSLEEKTSGLGVLWFKQLHLPA